jgi:hypothetical protein
MGSSDISFSVVRTEEEEDQHGDHREKSTEFPEKCTLSLDQPREFARVVVKAREDRLEVSHSDVFRENLTNNGAKVRR